jgi:cytochrome c-type biogenesis protein CcmE
VNKKARTRLLVTVSVLVVVGVVATIFIAYRQGTQYLHVGQLEPSFDGQRIKVSGKVVDITAKDASTGAVTFTMAEDRPGEPEKTVQVEYGKPPAGTFDTGVFVFVEGTYRASPGVIAAKSMQTKCPSKYEAQAQSPAAAPAP